MRSEKFCIIDTYDGKVQDDSDIMRLTIRARHEFSFYHPFFIVCAYNHILWFWQSLRVSSSASLCWWPVIPAALRYNLTQLPVSVLTMSSPEQKKPETFELKTKSEGPALDYAAIQKCVTGITGKHFVVASRPPLSESDRSGRSNRFALNNEIQRIWMKRKQFSTQRNKDPWSSSRYRGSKAAFRSPSVTSRITFPLTGIR